MNTRKIAQVFRMAQIFKEKIMDYERMKKRSIKVTRIITEALQLLQQTFNKLKRLMQQLLITMSSTRWKKKIVHDRRPSAINIIRA